MSANFGAEDASARHRKELLLSTGCPKMDARFKGGFPCQGITHIYGGGGTGKTQLALQLCLTVQLPIKDGGLAGGAVYVCSQCSFPSRRLQQLLERSEIAKTYSDVNGDVIYVATANTFEDLKVCLRYKIPALMRVCKINLVIVDTIAGAFRFHDYYNGSSSLKNTQLARTIKLLHALSKNGNVCVVCLNQISTLVDLRLQEDEHDEETPALGRVWATGVTSTLKFTRFNNVRHATVKVSPRLPNVTVPFVIKESGVEAIE